MNKVSVWISAMRLRTLPLSISGIILASCFAIYNDCFNWLIFILAILTTLSFQILSNLANDYGDGIKGTDNNNRIGPDRAIQTGKIWHGQVCNKKKNGETYWVDSRIIPYNDGYISIRFDITRLKQNVF